MYSRHGYLSNSPYHSHDLLRHSNIKRVCYCLRGTTRLANCFGPWDHLAIEIPPGHTNSRHVSDGKFLLSDLKQPAVLHRKTLPSIVRCPKRGSAVSLGYLSRNCAANDGGLCKFRHFATVAEHIRHYRQNKPNSLYEPTEQESAVQASDAGEELVEICRCMYCCSHDNNEEDNAVIHINGEDRLRDSNYDSNETCVCAEHTSPHPLALKATGKAVLPSNPNLLVPPPSLEEMSDTYWVPVNAVFQRRQVSADQYNSLGYYDQLTVKFPSLRKKTFGDEFPKPKKKIALKRIVDSSSDVLYNETLPEVERRRVSTEKTCVCNRPEVSTTTYRPFAGPGRLLSGKLMPAFPNHQESFDSLVIGVKKTALSAHPDCNMVVGVPKSLYETQLLNSPSSTKRSAQVSRTADTTTTTTTTTTAAAASTFTSTKKKASASSSKREEFLDGSTAGPVAVRMPNTSTHISKQIPPKPPAPTEPEQALNELHITCENCRREKLLEETATLDSPMINSSPVELNLTNERIPCRRPSSRLHRLSQENLYKPTNVSITFKKPMKLFRVRSVQKKMLQHDNVNQQKEFGKSRYGESYKHREMKSGTLKSSRHRSALNRREGSAQVEGVFGTQNHHTISCVLRSRERRKLKLETVNFIHQNNDSETANLQGHRTKVRVYLVKTKRKLEDILPKLNCQEEAEVSTVDMYGE